jgi:signal transduction histidine kinase
MRIASVVLSAALLAAFALQLFGVKPLYSTLTTFQILNVLGLLTFAASCLWEGFHEHNKEARQFALPSFILLAASLLEFVNYYSRFTNVLSFFFLSGVALFTVCLGAIALRYVRRAWREADEKQRRAGIFRKLSHDLRTPLTKVSTNIQTARRRPEEADELLEKSQDVIMTMADMINDALTEADEEVQK